MDILKFALGVRFDTLNDSVDEEDIRNILSELSNALALKDVQGLHIFGGVCELSPTDSRGIYTVVFMNGRLGQMRSLYSKLDRDAVIHAMLDSRIPYIQNNVIRNFTGMEFIGCAAADGSVEGGTNRGIKFGDAVQQRAVFSEKNSILIAPNSFKGTVSAPNCVRHIAKAVRKKLPNALIVPVPVADGGDGTLSAIESSLLSLRRSMNVTAPYGDPVRADYLVLEGTDAVIESALASGLALCKDRELDPLTASSIGTGELMLRAAHEGVKRIFVCLGGSATNDCGIGLARALGCRFLSAEGEEISSAAQMERIETIDASNIDPMIRNTKITAVCDVENPLTGENGATYTFGPQKGAKGETLESLERGMLNMEKLLDSYTGKAVCSDKGAGAAGGMGAMLMALFGAEYVSGSEALLDIADFDNKLKNAALVITGEGRLDETSEAGKAVGVILDHAEKAKVPATLICGCRGNGAESLEKRAAAVEYCGSVTDALNALDEAAEKLIASAAEKLGL